MSDIKLGSLPLKHAIVNPLYIPSKLNTEVKKLSSSQQPILDSAVNEVLTMTKLAQGLYAGLPKADRKLKHPLMAWRLDMPIVHTDEGHGSFGQIPDLRAYFLLSSKNPEASLRRNWPKDSWGNPMKYAGSINVGIWAHVFHNLTKWKTNKWTTLSYYGIERNLEAFDDRSLTNTTYHLWVAGQTANPGTEKQDCFVYIQSVRMEDDFHEFMNQILADRAAKLESAIPYTKYLELFNQLQQEASDANKEWLVSFPTGFLGKPKLGIDLEDGNYRLHDALSEQYPFSQDYRNRITVFGEPRGQQTPHRWIAPNPLPAGPRALAPLLHWKCPDADMDMQVLADLPSHDRFAVNHYCKLQGTCT